MSPIDQRKKNIYVLALGGTITSIAPEKTDEFYACSSNHIEELIASLPLDTMRVHIICEQLFQKISHEITHEDLIFIANYISKLVERDDVDGIVISQGTNGLEETAYFMNLLVNTTKNIVFTGALRPSNALGYDGARNLYNALLLAANPKIEKCGVVLTFNDSIVHARDASKSNPSVLSDFSFNGAGLAGMIQGEKLSLQRMNLYKHTYQSEFNIRDIHTLPKIEIIYGSLGVGRTFVDAAVAHHAEGIISAGLGKGYQPQDLTDGLIQAGKQGILVVRCSRSGQGIVNRDPQLDDEYGFIAGGSLTPQKAKILLSVAMTITKDKQEIQRIFDEY